MKRRTLDILFSAGAAMLAGLLIIMGVVLTNNASFSRDYVAEQLGEQKITFKAADALSEEELAFTEARTGCLVTYAGQAVTTGKQAECYANELILGHMRSPEGAAQGRTFTELGAVQGDLRGQIRAATDAGDTPTVTTLEEELATVTAARETVFKGEMLRGALLSTYGFSQLGEKAQQGANVAFIVGVVLLLLAAAGFVHAFRTPKSEAFAPVENGKAREAQLPRARI